MFTPIVASASTRGSIHIGRPRFFNGGLHLDFGVLQWSKIVEVQDEARNNSQLDLYTSLEDNYILDR